MKKLVLLALALMTAIYGTAVTVTFQDWNGSTIATEDVTAGEGAYEPEHPTRDGYVFAGWSTGFAPVYANTIVTAQYQALGSAGDDVEVYYPLSENTNASVKGPVEPFSLAYLNIGDVLYSTTVSNLVFPASSGFDASHKVIMLNMPEAEALATTYDPYVYAQVAAKAAAGIDIDEISILVGSSGWQDMRFTLRYSLNSDFSNPVELATTDKLGADKMTEITEAVTIHLKAGETIYLRIYPWMDNLSEAFANLGIAFYPLLSELRITGSVNDGQVDPDPDPETPSASDTIAYYAFPDGAYMSSTSGTNVEGVNCTVDFSGIGNKDSNAQIVDGVYYLKMTTNASYVTLKPVGNKIQSGDSIFVRLNHSSKRKLGVDLAVLGSGTEVSAQQSADGEEVIAKAQLTHDDINDDGTITIYRIDGNSSFVRSFLVTRDQNAPKPTIYYVSYYDQNGAKIGEQTVPVEDPALSFEYGENDLPAIGEGNVFRGWFTAIGRKVRDGEQLDGNLSLYAKVTAKEVPSSTARYLYALNTPYFYPEDHECFDHSGGAFSSADKAWKWDAAGKITLTVSDHAYIETTINGATNTAYYANQSTVDIALNAGDKVSAVNIYNVLGQVEKQAGYYQIPAGDANSFLMVLQQIQDGEKIFLPDGDYDLGNLVLTEVKKNNVSIIGQSMEGTVIRNEALAPGISSTGTLFITGTGTYLQDLTLQNNFDYYAKNEGQADALHDRGDKTICKNVRLLSYQDTYYSNKTGAQKYFEDCEIHGTVDFICGDGTVYFERTLLFAENRYAGGGGSDALTASNAQAGDKGYIFNHCRVQSVCPVVSLGRSWSNKPQCVFLNTTLDYSAGQFALTGNGIQRWTIAGMNVLPERFGEYNTMDSNGNVISPASNEVTFTLNGDSKTMETILSADEAQAFSYENVFSAWDPASVAQQVELTYHFDNSQLVWNATEATVFLIATDQGATIVESLPTSLPDNATVRAANAKGGFGAPAFENTGHALHNTECETKAVKVIRDGVLYIIKNGVRYTILGVPQN